MLSSDYYYTMPNLISSEEKTELLRLAKQSNYWDMNGMVESIGIRVLQNLFLENSIKKESIPKQFHPIWDSYIDIITSLDLNDPKLIKLKTEMKALGSDSFDEIKHISQEFMKDVVNNLHSTTPLAESNYHGALEAFSLVDTENEMILDIMRRYSHFKFRGVCFLHAPPNAVVKKHVDPLGFRLNTLSIPLSDNFAGTYFYENVDADEPIFYCAYTEPTLLNVQKPHSVTNNDQHRYVLQITFDETYENVRDFYKNSA